MRRGKIEQPNGAAVLLQVGVVQAPGFPARLFEIFPLTQPEREMQFDQRIVTLNVQEPQPAPEQLANLCQGLVLPAILLSWWM